MSSVSSEPGGGYQTRGNKKTVSESTASRPGADDEDGPPIPLPGLLPQGELDPLNTKRGQFLSVSGRLGIDCDC